MNVPTVTIPTELHMALVKLLDIIPPILEDWMKTTGFGEVHDRDNAALVSVLRAKRLHQEWLAEAGVTVDSPAITRADIERMKRLRMERGEVATQTVGISGASAAMQAGGMPRRGQYLPDATSPGPDWGQLESDVFRKIRLLRAAWEHTATAIPKGHEAMKRDLYVPALSHLAAFCGCVEEEDSDD